MGVAVEHATEKDGSLVGKRRSSISRAASGKRHDGHHPPMPRSLPHHLAHAGQANSLVEGTLLSSLQAMDKSKNHTRRMSDASRLSRKDKTGELKCEHCGKAYKHGSCLNKHLWEHTPQWQYTSKLLISKHQQVQLLEAASVLVQMNADGTPTITQDSDRSSSPAVSGFSERDEDVSSAETTPPPHPDPHVYRDHDATRKRHSTASSSAYSRSYQSVFSSSSITGGGGLPHHHRHSSSSSAGGHTTHPTAYRDEDPQDLAAAVGLLSCSYGTPKSAPLVAEPDVPPVPPLPEKYAHAQSHAQPVHRYATDHSDVDMEDDDDDEDDEGMFGQMDA